MHINIKYNTKLSTATNKLFNLINSFCFPLSYFHQLVFFRASLSQLCTWEKETITKSDDVLCYLMECSVINSYELEFRYGPQTNWREREKERKRNPPQNGPLKINSVRLKQSIVNRNKPKVWCCNICSCGVHVNLFCPFAVIGQITGFNDVYSRS